MKRLLASLALFLIALTVPAPATLPLTPAPMLADEEKPPESSGWWESLSAKKWEFSFVPGDTRYGFRLPVYPALICIVVIITCSNMLDNASRQKKSAAGPGVAMGVGIFLFLALLWQSAFRESKTPIPSPLFEIPGSLKPHPSLFPSSQFPPGESPLRPLEPHTGSRAAELIKGGNNNGAPAKPAAPADH